MDRLARIAVRDRLLERLAAPTPLIMGILNVTPDSFSDGGAHDTLFAAQAHARQMAEDGADILDIGGESTRPGGDPVSFEDEWARVREPITRLPVRAKHGIKVGQSLFDFLATHFLWKLVGALYPFENGRDFFSAQVEVFQWRQSSIRQARAGLRVGAACRVADIFGQVAVRCGFLCCRGRLAGACANCCKCKEKGEYTSHAARVMRKLWRLQAIQCKRRLTARFWSPKSRVPACP